jgi:bacteriocin-like protein
MRELTANELKAVSGGVMAITVRKEPPILALVVKLILAFFKRPECRPVAVREMAA